MIYKHFLLFAIISVIGLTCLGIFYIHYSQPEPVVEVYRDMKNRQSLSVKESANTTTTSVDYLAIVLDKNQSTDAVPGNRLQSHCDQPSLLHSLPADSDFRSSNP